MERTTRRGLAVVLLAVGCGGAGDASSAGDATDITPPAGRDRAPSSDTSPPRHLLVDEAAVVHTPSPGAPPPTTGDVRLAHMQYGTNESVDLCITQTGAPSAYAYRSLAAKGIARFTVGRYLSLPPGHYRLYVISGSTKAADCSTKTQYAYANVQLDVVVGQRTTISYYGTYHFDPDSPYWEDHIATQTDLAIGVAGKESVRALQFLGTDRTSNVSVVQTYATPGGTTTLPSSGYGSFPAGQTGQLTTTVHWSYPFNDDSRTTSAEFAARWLSSSGRVTTLFTVGKLGPSTNDDVRVLGCDDLAPPAGALAACSSVSP